MQTFRSAQHGKSPSRPRSTPRPLAQRGQALVWLLGTLAASVAVLYGVYSTGQISAQKQRVINAADTAALAGAAVEARVLNLMAYNNRAMIANEVFMIQTVAMQGWFQYLKTTSDNVEDYVKWIPYAGPYLSKVLTTFSQISAKVEKLLDKFIPVQVKALELMKTGYSASHKVLREGTSVIADSAAADVVNANRTQFAAHADAGMQVDGRAAVKLATTAKNWNAWRGFSRQYSGNDRGDAAGVLKASRDEFTRGSRPGAGWMNIDLYLTGFDKLGDTQLVNFDRWETQDTYEFWIYGFDTCEKLEWAKCYERVGWGRGNLDKSKSSGGVWSPGRDAQNSARNDGHRAGKWSGVPSVYDLANRDPNQRETVGVDFLVAVKRDQANTLTTDTLGLGRPTTSVAGSPQMDERLLARQLSSLGKARVFFERPASNVGDHTAGSLLRHDSAKEFGSLFSPYWQARLTDVSATDKTAYMVALGMDPLSAAALSKFTPGGQ